MLWRVLGVWLLSGVLVLAQAADEDKAAPADDYVSYVELKPFIANFGGPGKMRFLKCEVTIQAGSEGAHHDINHHLPSIRNELVFLFSAQTGERLETVEGQGELAKEALQRVRQLLVEEEGEALIDDLFFTSFVVQ